jgi:hypothetical protein
VRDPEKPLESCIPLLSGFGETGEMAIFLVMDESGVSAGVNRTKNPP